jgi:hypothetical protein
MDSDMNVTNNKNKHIRQYLQHAIFLLLLTGGISSAYSGENASNPLAAVNNTDVRLQYFDLEGGADRWDFFVADGAYMLSPKLKLKYELHYWDTNVTGSSENAMESLHVKPIYFPEKMIGKVGDWKYKVAIGAELIIDFDHTDKGIGSGSDQFAPLVGVAMVQNDTVLVPLIQHFVEFDGPDVNTTAFRMIAIQSYANNVWGKLDAIVPVDWENDNEIPATVEVQLGKMFSPAFGLYMDGLLGIGTDKPYEWGVGVGARFNY